jgi:hypothetical protein
MRDAPKADHWSSPVYRALILNCLITSGSNLQSTLIPVPHSLLRFLQQQLQLGLRRGNAIAEADVRGAVPPSHKDTADSNHLAQLFGDPFPLRGIEGSSWGIVTAGKLMSLKFDLPGMRLHTRAERACGRACVRTGDSPI